MDSQCSAFDILMGSAKQTRKHAAPRSPLCPTRSLIHKRKKVSKKKPTSMIQSCLDLGQHNVERSTTCAHCGMMYLTGEREDEAQHATFCQQQQVVLFPTPWKNERLVTMTGAGHRIIEIRTDDPAAHVRKLHDIQRLMNLALGGSDDPSHALFQEHQRAFVFIMHKQVVGCVIAEQIKFGYSIQDPGEALWNASNHTLRRSDRREKALLGISRIWVHSTARRQHVASSLVTSIRQTLIYGIECIPLHQIAFSQPTRLGLAFANEYCAPYPVLVYE